MHMLIWAGFFTLLFTLSHVYSLVCSVYTPNPSTEHRPANNTIPKSNHVYEVKSKKKKIIEKRLFTHSIFIHFQHAAGADVNNNNISTQMNETCSEHFTIFIWNSGFFNLFFYSRARIFGTVVIWFYCSSWTFCEFKRVRCFGKFTFNEMNWWTRLYTDDRLLNWWILFSLLLITVMDPDFRTSKNKHIFQREIRLIYKLLLLISILQKDDSDWFLQKKS